MKKLLILDLDETLVHCDTDYSLRNDCDYSFELGNGLTYYIRKRPHLNQFLDYAFNNFNVAIWTAGGSEYASAILDKCNILINGLDFFWTREKCIIKMGLNGNYGVKDLRKIKKEFGYDLNKVLIIDDVNQTAENNINNLINIKSFYYDENDTELLKLIKYLDSIKHKNVIKSIENKTWSKDIKDI